MSELHAKISNYYDKTQRIYELLWMKMDKPQIQKFMPVVIIR
jgi:hypothetical protein